MTSASLPFKRLDLSHLTKMMEIEREVFRSPWSASMMRDSLQAAHIKAWGLFDEETLLGYGVTSSVADEFEILTMSVALKHHRQGCGDKLMTFFIDQAKKSDAKKIYLEVNVHNLPAIEFYRKHHFKQTGLRKGYYAVPDSNEKDDALLMALDI
jgi:ribosomal-protein-alanine N-acetyltransferase